MEPTKKTAIALRPEIIPPHEIVKLAKIIDQSAVSHLFIPDIPFSFDSVEISGACLGVSKGLRVGSGVFRPLEHDLQQLVRRLGTLQSLSENRYLLGVGTGQPGQNPQQKISALLQRLEEIRSGFKESSIHFPESYVATLRVGIARQVAGKADGIILNFCPPEYATTVVGAVRKSYSGTLEVACYMKAFFSESEEAARRLAIAEFMRYDMLPQYHKMFERSGVSEDILAAARSLQGKDLHYSEKLRRACPVNPDLNELQKYISTFREAGISLPCIYPYFSPDENFEFKHGTISSIISAAE